MEMYVNSFKNIVLSSLKSAGSAIGGLYRGARALLRGPGGRGAGTDVERRAENDRQRYNAQAIATAWQGLRYIK